MVYVVEIFDEGIDAGFTSYADAEKYTFQRYLAYMASEGYKNFDSPREIIEDIREVNEDLMDHGCIEDFAFIHSVKIDEKI